METVNGDVFFEWAADIGIGFDPRYPSARSLGFIPPRDHSRFWTLPGDPAAWPDLIAAALEAIDPWFDGYLWPRQGRWAAKADPRCPDERTRDIMLRGAGVPDSWPGAVRFGRGEADEIIAVVFVCLCFGCCVDDDLYFIPDHGRQIVHADHHGVLHVSSADEDRIRELVESMAGAGHLLPARLPDATFKPPSWMKSAVQPPD